MGEGGVSYAYTVHVHVTFTLYISACKKRRS